MADTEHDPRPVHIGTETRIVPHVEVEEHGYSTRAETRAEGDWGRNTVDGDIGSIGTLDQMIYLMSLCVTERMLRMSLTIDPAIQDLVLTRIQFLIKGYREGLWSNGV